MSIIEGLNPEQCRAVGHVGGPILVLAGAGSGKTRILAHRVAYLVERREVAPHAILAITFTNKAAAEMKRRIESLLGQTSRDIWVCTFHAACGRILRREIERLGYGKEFAIFDESDQLTLVRLCLKELNLAESRYPPRAVLARIGRAKNELIGCEEFAQRARDYFTEKVATLYSFYQRKLKDCHALDFDDLIMVTVKLLRDFPDVLDAYRRRFNHILIDEYQDTNHAQYVLVNLLASQHRNLFVVGDDDQSIYGWRGADIRNILEFEKDYPDAKVFKLEQNYRSTGIILEAANQIVGNNRGRKEKRLWTENERGSSLTCYRAQDEHDEAEFVVRSVVRLAQEEGLPLSAFAVLYRTNAQSRVLEEALMRRGIPYRVVAGLRFYERKEIKDIVAYLRLVCNDRDFLSLERAMAAPRRGIGPATVARIAEFAVSAGLGFCGAMRVAESVPGVGRKSADTLREFASWLEGLTRVRDVAPLVRMVVEESGYIAALEADGGPEALSRVENIKEFYSVAREFEQSSDEPGLGPFLARISLLSELDAVDERGNAVVLMTLHSAKGLEFPVVFLPGMEEGLFPHARSLSDPDEMEEERRLCYVGVTRAQRMVFFCHALTRTMFGQRVRNSVSRFVSEVPGHLLTVQSGGSGEIRMAGPGGPVRAGDRVEHARWGIGTVVSVGGKEDDPELVVAFPAAGIKRLIARYAPLRRV